MIRFATTSTLAALLGACGPGGPSPGAQVPKAPIEAAPQLAEAPAPGGLEPVEAPGELIMHLRWRRPADTLADLERLVGASATPAGDVVSLMFEQLEGAEGVDAARLRDAVALDAPADLIAVMVDPDAEPLVVASVGLRSVKAGLAAFSGEVSRSDGTWLAYGPETVDTEPEPETEADVDPFDVDLKAEDVVPPTCIISPALGPAPARMVCGADGDAAKRLATFAARNVAAMPSSADDLRIDFSVGRWTRQLAQKAEDGWPEARDEITEQGVGDARLAAVLRRVGDSVVREGNLVLDELDRVTVAANVGDRGLDFVLELGMAGRRSVLGRMLADAAEHEGPPPAMMKHLPDDFSSAEFGRTGARNMVASGLTASRDVISALMDAEKMGSPADRKAWLALLRDTASDHADFVNATGVFGPVAGSNGAPLGRSWWVYGIEQPSAPTVKWLRDAVRAYNRPAVRRLVRAKLDADAARSLPRVRLVPVAPPFVARLVIDLPKGLANPPAGGSKGPTIPRRYELLVLADGDRTWTGVASDGAALETLMVKLPQAQGSSNAAPSRTAATQRVLSALAGREVTQVSVTTIRGIMEDLNPFVSVLSQTLGTAGPAWWTTGALPHGGVAPILTVVDATGGDRPSVRISLELPRPALEDFAFLGKHVGRAIGAAIGTGLGAGLGLPAPPPTTTPPAGPPVPPGNP